MDDTEELSELDEIAEEALAALYRNGKHYDRKWLRDNARKAQAGPNPVKKIIVDLGVGDSMERLDSTKGQKLHGPQSIEVVYWPDGGIDQNCYGLGKAPEMPRSTSNGRYLSSTPTQGRKVGEYFDKDIFEWNGTAKTAREWYEHPSRIDGLSLTTFKARLKNQGMGVEEALTKPAVRGGRRVPKKAS
ncbi:hypothetical protein [Streptomyces sp. H27-C3]|uniref:hypothetical protein n=1 Tax=Streptomyces sp. H27-C3 TaxID=3046305 RepID=UPI0024B99735|nr:hypothetical protein [Streptomyces sp. H27-C3]MDJ0463072.1 hypothetical protein [Streptomyces sp. H27-C3]